MEEINIPDSVIFLEGFSNCISLKTVYMGKHVDDLGLLCFYDCKNLLNVFWGCNKPSKWSQPFLGTPNDPDGKILVNWIERGSLGWGKTFASRPIRFVN